MGWKPDTAVDHTTSGIQESPPAHRILWRTADFWRRVCGIFIGYQVAQVQAGYLRFRGESEESIQAEHWEVYYNNVGQDMHNVCVDMRGLLLKAGQLIGARSDVVPEGICAYLRKLQDKVPPMSPCETKDLILRELKVAALSDVFEWIDLDNPLGSASIAQVHKAKLRRYEALAPAPVRLFSSPFRATRGLLNRLIAKPEAPSSPACVHTVNHGDSAWSIANQNGISLEQLHTSNKLNTETSLASLVSGDSVWLPASCCSSRGTEVEDHSARVIAAVRRANAKSISPRDGTVAVKVQYPDAQGLFTQDLVNLRLLARLLTWSEIAKFDFVSAVDELSAQVQLEFNFKREARVMDRTFENLKHLRAKVVVPRSVPGLVTDRLLVMSFLDGMPLNQLQDRAMSIRVERRKMASKMVISRTAEAYGTMMLSSGLFQADGHPGNILVMPNGAVGLIDYGQSKQLSDEQRRLLARLVIALANCHTPTDKGCITDLSADPLFLDLFQESVGTVGNHLR